MRPLRTLLIAAALTPALALSACDSNEDKAAPAPSSAPTAAATAGATSGAGDEALTADVEVVPTLTGVTVDSKDAKKPSVKVASTPLRVDRSRMQVLTPGTGDKITDDMAVTIDYVLVNARDGKQAQSTFEQGSPESFPMKQTITGMAAMLRGQQVGAKVVGALTPKDGFASRGGVPALGIGVSDPVVVYVEVKSAKVPLTKATGTEVPPKEGMPTAVFHDDKPADITIPKGKAAPTASEAAVVIQGKGPKVTKGQQITVHYTGVTWADGKMFDSSKKTGLNEPATFGIGTGNVIPCWDKNLVGQTIGSRVILVCTPADAYKDQEKPGIPKNSTLVFLVDILDAVTPAQPEPQAPPTEPATATASPKS